MEKIRFKVQGEWKELKGKKGGLSFTLLPLPFALKIFMIFLYNILQFLALLILAPFLLVVLLTPKYRGRILSRLGWGLAEQCRAFKPGQRIWIHALSVGEAASAQPLVEALRAQLPEACLIFSSTTRGGANFAGRMSGVVDYFVPFPLDLHWSVCRFLDCIAPDLFVLIETDLWPNFLAQLGKRHIPSVLANGRVTEHSFQGYDRFRFFFAPLFDAFTVISMQMHSDAARMVRLGIAPQKVRTLGNLKYDIGSVAPSAAGTDESWPELAARTFVVVAGSTHEGEEEILLEACVPLFESEAGFQLIIAPRRIERGAEVDRLARNRGRRSCRRTAGWQPDSQVLVLDTLGELSRLYRVADIAFVGGSLVDEGGHNPLEPASLGKPVIFGEFMSDFAEISKALVDAGAARQVRAAALAEVLMELHADRELRIRMGRSGTELVRSHQGATERYVALIRKMLAGEQ